MRSLSLLVALSLLAAACRSTAADESAGGPPLDDAAMMEMMTQLAQPDEHHEVLDVLVGDWDVETRMWMSPDAAPIVEHGTMSANWVLGGRFIEQRFVGSMMGAPFEGLGLMGYDRVREAYVGFWLDSAGTQMLDIATGQVGEDGSVITMHRDYMLPGMGTTRMREVTTLHASNHHTFEIFSPLPGSPGAGNEFKMLEVDYQRR